LMGQVRFVLGKSNTQEQIDAFLYHLNAIVSRYIPQTTTKTS
jgi:cysteine sulfinate desulfinase/cysteine desulfurase-like protein